jgi:hypothetical protein
MIGLGIYANAVSSALIITILFPLWLIALIMPIGKIFRILRFVIAPFLVIATLLLLIGLWSPEVKQSIDRGTGNMKSGIANSFNESSSHSENESGIFRKVKENVTTARFLEDDSQPFSIEAADTIKVVSWDGVKATGLREGFSRVVCKNIHGHFDGAKVGWIPTRLLQEGSAIQTSIGTGTTIANETYRFHSTVDFRGGGFKKSFYQKILEAGEYNITRIAISTNDGKSFETKETFSVTEEEGKKFAIKTPGAGDPQVITLTKKGVR